MDGGWGGGGGVCGGDGNGVARGLRCVKRESDGLLPASVRMTGKRATSNGRWTGRSDGIMGVYQMLSDAVGVCFYTGPNPHDMYCISSSGMRKR